ncbi:lysophospholipid acyltransferase family protein [Roseateles depolymerans]|uniref:Acyl-phosphate glycerol 3-phosphate acyltransferase n=1 Tax=Roseateles depolymerans TaxID=76731 RepID=A0A0U3LUS1_9BURK|nr:lysophospholipid acyltransferase family protein [Roseateles depolymerans]ALV08823.1 acyl-phosphate glycerol 3-phosphate acyltransferase [Roseateles depolymerans]REG20944.1 1-acyl-sn-glycerol-3-phosphate acyltransferase [Roseateles depolymerans]
MLAALRSLLFVLWLTVTVIPWGTAVVLVSPFLSSTRLYWMCAGWLTVAMWGARVICGVRWKVRGMEHLPTGAKESVILLSKHQSTWETFAYPMLMPRPLAYVFKRELIYVPFFGWAMSRLDMIHIDRSKRSEAWSKVLAQGKRLAAQGTWVIMFPEGTRVARGTAGDYKTGGTRLAVETGQPVVPIAVNAARCWPRKSFLLRPGVVDISIGPQIPSTGRAPAELMQEVQGWIEAEMRRLDPDAYPASAPAPVAAPPASAPV